MDYIYSSCAKLKSEEEYFLWGDETTNLEFEIIVPFNGTVSTFDWTTDNRYFYSWDSIRIIEYPQQFMVIMNIPFMFPDRINTDSYLEMKINVTETGVDATKTYTAAYRGVSVYSREATFNIGRKDIDIYHTWFYQRPFSTGHVASGNFSLEMWQPNGPLKSKGHDWQVKLINDKARISIYSLAGYFG